MGLLRLLRAMGLPSQGTIIRNIVPLGLGERFRHNRNI